MQKGRLYDLATLPEFRLVLTEFRLSLYASWAMAWAGCVGGLRAWVG
jgi:hypothetical protein